MARKLAFLLMLLSGCRGIQTGVTATYHDPKLGEISIRIEGIR